MKNNFKPRSKLEAWVRKFGGTKALAEKLGVNQSAVQQWLRGASNPRAETCHAIVKLAKGKITLVDIFKGTGRNGL